MTYEELRTAVRFLLQDPSGSFGDDLIAFSANSSLFEIGATVGQREARSVINSVQSQDEYLLPSGLSRLRQVMYIPDGQNNDNRGYLVQEVQAEGLPSDLMEGGPMYFYLNLRGGTDSNTPSITVYPIPDDSTSEFVIDYDGIWSITCDEVATSPQLAQVLPIPEVQEQVLTYKTASGVLMTSSDNMDLQKAGIYKQRADELLTRMAFTNSNTFMNSPRLFP